MKKFNTIQFLFDYGTLLVLALLCAWFSYVTIEEQSPTSTAAAEHLAKRVGSELPADANVLVLVRQGGEGESFANTLTEQLGQAGVSVGSTTVGQPADARKALTEFASTGAELAGIIADKHMANFSSANLDRLGQAHPGLAKAKIYQPESYRWPNFLKRENLLNIMKQISVVAIIAIGMTMVIITAGIDLSVGSLIAFSGVITALAIQSLGGDAPTTSHLWLGALAGILICGLAGLFTGGLVTGRLLAANAAS